MNVERSFIETRRQKGIGACVDSNEEEEYYKWRIRSLERKIRDVKAEITRISNIKGIRHRH